DRRPPLVDQRPRRVPTRLPGLADRAGDRDDPARDPRTERRALERAGLKLSVVIPARNEEESVASTILGLAGALESERIDYELLVVDDASTDRTREVVEGLAGANARVRYHRS